MTTVVVRCDQHGQFEVPIHAVTLNVCTTDPALSYYTFPCLRCGIVQRPADLRITAILYGANVRLIHWTVPAEALEPHSGPAITWDDLLTFHYSLGAELASLVTA